MLFSIKPGVIWKKQKKAKKRHFERANFGSSNDKNSKFHKKDVEVVENL